MKVPGIVYSLLLAIGAWAVDWFTTGGGAGVPWAPILLATIPVVLKMFTVQAPPEEPTPTPQGDFGGPLPQRSSKTHRLLWG